MSTESTEHPKQTDKQNHGHQSSAVASSIMSLKPNRTLMHGSTRLAIDIERKLIVQATLTSQDYLTHIFANRAHTS